MGYYRNILRFSENIYKTMKDLSIIIINWNSKQYLKRCVESICRTVNDISFEIIVIDNDSADKDFSCITKISERIVLIENRENTGFSVANNQGAKVARGDYLLFLNPDTEVRDGAINVLFDCVQKGGYAVSGPKLIEEDGKIQLMCARSLPSLTGAIYNLFLLERVFSQK